MNPYFCTVNVLLNEPVRAKGQSGEDHGKLAGYYRNVGIRAENVSEAMSVLKSIVDNGEIKWSETVVHEFEKVDETISMKYYENQQETVWYRSGRIYYPLQSE